MIPNLEYFRAVASFQPCKHSKPQLSSSISTDLSASTPTRVCCSPASGGELSPMILTPIPPPSFWMNFTPSSLPSFFCDLFFCLSTYFPSIYNHGVPPKRMPYPELCTSFQLPSKKQYVHSPSFHSSSLLCSKKFGFQSHKSIRWRVTLAWSMAGQTE